MECRPSIVAPYDGHRLRWSDVVTRLPIHVFKVRTEMFGEHFLATGESVSATHECAF
jgi:hypothetical protein